MKFNKNFVAGHDRIPDMKKIMHKDYDKRQLPDSKIQPVT